MLLQFAGRKFERKKKKKRGETSGVSDLSLTADTRHGHVDVKGAVPDGEDGEKSEIKWKNGRVWC